MQKQVDSDVKVTYNKIDPYFPLPLIYSNFTRTREIAGFGNAKLTAPATPLGSRMRLPPFPMVLSLAH